MATTETDIAISALPLVTAPLPTDMLPIVSDSVTSRISLADLLGTAVLRGTGVPTMIAANGTLYLRDDFTTGSPAYIAETVGVYPPPAGVSGYVALQQNEAGIAAAYPLDDTPISNGSSAENAVASSGYGSGIYTANIAPAAPIIVGTASAANFTANAYVATHFQPEALAAWSIEFLFQPLAGSTTGSFAGTGDTAGFGHGLRVYAAGGALALDIGTAAGIISLVGPTTGPMAYTPDGERVFHVVVGYDGTTYFLYLNGTLAASEAGGPPLNPGTPFILGVCSGVTGSGFSGKAGGIGCYGSMLSDGAVAAHFDGIVVGATATTWKNVALTGDGGAGGGATELAEDSDVAIVSAADGDVLTYSGEIAKWINKASDTAALVASVGVTAPITNTGTATAPVIGLAAPLPVADGGSGTATPGLVEGENVTITGTWPNQTIAAPAPGSTALASDTDVLIASPADGNVLTYDGASAKWENKAPAAPVASTLASDSDIDFSTAGTGKVLAVVTSGGKPYSFVAPAAAAAAISYDAFTLTEPNLQAYYPMNDAAGSSAAVDAKGGAAGTYLDPSANGAPSITPDGETCMHGNVSGDGGTATLQVPHVLSAVWSLRIVVKTDLANVNGHNPSLFQTDAGDGGIWFIAQGNGGGTAHYLVIYNTGRFQSVYTYTGGVDVLFLTYDGTTLSLYVNGALDSSAAVAPSAFANGTSTSDFGSAGGGQYFKGSMAKVAFYAAAVSAGTISADYDCFLSGTSSSSDSSGATTLAMVQAAEASLTHLWRCNDASGATALADSKGSTPMTVGATALCGAPDLLRSGGGGVALLGTSATDSITTPTGVLPTNAPWTLEFVAEVFSNGTAVFLNIDANSLVHVYSTNGNLMAAFEISGADLATGVSLPPTPFIYHLTGDGAGAIDLFLNGMLIASQSGGVTATDGSVLFGYFAGHSADFSRMRVQNIATYSAQFTQAQVFAHVAAALL